MKRYIFLSAWCTLFFTSMTFCWELSVAIANHEKNVAKYLLMKNMAEQHNAKDILDKNVGAMFIALEYQDGEKAKSVLSRYNLLMNDKPFYRYPERQFGLLGKQFGFSHEFEVSTKPILLGNLEIQSRFAERMVDDGEELLLFPKKQEYKDICAFKPGRPLKKVKENNF